MILTSSLAFGADEGSTATAFMKCARISSDAQRLSCYDRLATELIELGVSSPGDTASSASGAPATLSGVAAPSLPSGDAGAAVTEPVQPGPPASADGPAGNPEEGFGQETMRDTQDDNVKSIRSRYVGEFTGWDGNTTFPLENGQVWQQIESGRMSWKATNPMITIKHGFMGGYKLSVEGVNRTVRVKRIK